jgi:hypothetical protein
MTNKTSHSPSTPTTSTSTRATASDVDGQPIPTPDHTCRCDGATYVTEPANRNRHPFLVHPQCPIHPSRQSVANPLPVAGLAAPDATALDPGEILVSGTILGVWDEADAEAITAIANAGGLDVGPIAARAAAATPGPWAWRGNTDTRQLRIDARGRTVMDFVRWGMRDGAPRFNVDMWMHRADELGVVYEVCRVATGRDDPRVYRADIVDVRHPDAEFIAHARADVDALLAEVERLRAQRAALLALGAVEPQPEFPVGTYVVIDARKRGPWGRIYRARLLEPDGLRDGGWHYDVSIGRSRSGGAIAGDEDWVAVVHEGITADRLTLADEWIDVVAPKESDRG